MKILLVEPYGTRPGHFGLYASQIGQELAKLGHTVVVVTATRLDARSFLGEEPLFRVAEVGSKANFHASKVFRLPVVVRRSLHGPSVMWLNLVALRCALTLSLDESFDVLHLLDWEIFTTVTLLSWQKVVLRQAPPPLVMHINPVDFSYAVHAGGLLRRIYKAMARHVLRFVIRHFCSAVTVQGEWHRARLMDQLGCNRADAPPFVVVRPGTRLPHQQIPQTQARYALGLDPDATVFLFFGMLRKDKGIDLLLQATSELEGNWQLLIAGIDDDWTAEALKVKISQSRQPERVRADVRYIPEQEIGIYFRAADAIVLPYRGQHYVGNYGPMMLACGYGKPLIVSDVGEMGWLVRERRLGFSIRPDDAGALREALNSFLNLQAEIKSDMAARSLELAEECSFPSIARLLTDIFAGRSQQGVRP